MQITTSPDITQLIVNITWDISNPTPVCTLENLSTGSNLAGVSWAFVTTSPSNTPIHAGDINDPDIIGEWTDFTLSDPWPKPFNQVEWSGLPYSFYVVIKDSIGNVYTSPVQQATICRPFGNLPASKTTYGLATSDVKVQCQEAYIFFQDTTNHSYKGEAGTIISSVLRVIYPIDETYTIPDPFVASSYSTALVPITYSSKNYQFVQSSVYDYDQGDNTIVRIKYQTIQTFPVYCNIDLAPLTCEINKLINSIETGNCVDATEAKNKLGLIMGKFSLVVIGMLQPLTGVDVPLLIEEIIQIGGFDNCNCCNVATGIIPQTSSVIGGYNFAVNKLGGDITNSSNFSTNGNNITLNIGDVSYVVAIGYESPSDISAFSVTPVVSSNGFLKTYYINIDGTQLAEDILNIISTNANLVNLFNSIVTNNPGTWDLVVDGDCIFSSGTACDYAFGLTGIPANTDFAQVISIKTQAGSIPVNFVFNLTNLPALQSYLNTLNLGTFVVTDLGGGNVSITTTTNNNSLTGMVYSDGTLKLFATFASDCTGLVQRSANFVVQAIIDYICGLTDAQFVTSQDYTICYIDPVSNTKKTTTVEAGTAENLLIAEILDRQCDTVDYTIALKGVNCTSMKQLFVASPYLLQNTDFIYGTKVGGCAGISPIELATRQLQLGVYNADFMSALCAAVSLCNAGLTCDAYTVYQLSTTDGSPADTIDIIVTFSHPSAISNTIRYARIDNTNNPVFTTLPNILPGQSPYTIANVADGDYFVGITPIYSDGRSCAEVGLTTGYPVGDITAFSAVFNGTDIVIEYSASVNIPQLRVNINYPNGGQFAQLYTNDGNDITITPPALNYGDYVITMTPVYNANTGFYGQNTAPSIVAVTPPSNSTFTNNTSNALAPVSMLITDGDNVTTVAFNVASVAPGGIVSFYSAPSKQINSVVITFSAGTVGEGVLVALGSYIGVVSANQVVFSNIESPSSGIAVTVTDSSPM